MIYRESGNDKFKDGYEDNGDEDLLNVDVNIPILVIGTKQVNFANAHFANARQMQMHESKGLVLNVSFPFGKNRCNEGHENLPNASPVAPSVE